MLMFNLYISIVNRKISWPVLVLNYFFLADFKEMYYYCLLLLFIIIIIIRLSHTRLPIHWFLIKRRVLIKLYCCE